MIEINGINESTCPQAFPKTVVVEPDFDTIFRALNEAQPPRTKYYAIIREQNETKSHFLLRVFNEAMCWKCHLNSVTFDEYRVDIEYIE